MMIKVYLFISTNLIVQTVGLLYDPKECKTSREGVEYMGTVNTVNGLECQRWDSQEPHAHEFTDPKLFPDANLDAVSNFCRNPDLRRGPWCYSVDPNVTIQFCDIPWCPVFPECNGVQTNYFGNKHITRSGSVCQHWKDITTIQLEALQPYSLESLQENYCRNPDEKDGGPWCFTGNGIDDWEYCVISSCKPSATCTTTNLGTEYVGKRGITVSGRPCQRWDRQFPHSHGYTDPDMFPDSSLTDAENFCRNPDASENRVWCYTTDIDQQWEYCDIPVCTDCKQTVDGRGYMGTVSTSLNGNECRTWISHNISDSDQFPDVSVEAASNYCRNPGGKVDGVWCYTGTTDADWNYCDVPLCEEKCDKDSKERRIFKHILHVGIDGLHAACWQNASSGVPNFDRLESEGSFSYRARSELYTFSAPNWSAHVCGMGNEETGVTSNSWEAPWMGKQEAITPVTGLNYPMPCIFYYLKGMDGNIRTASFFNWPWIYEMTGKNFAGSSDYDFSCGTLSVDRGCDWDITRNVSDYMRNITNLTDKSYTFVHLDSIDVAGHRSGWCEPGYLNAIDSIDEMLGEMLDSIEGEEEVLFVLSSDHGGTPDGNHGRQEDEHLLIPIFFKGQGIKENYEIKGVTRNRDITPTVVWAMGLKGSDHWNSDVVYEIFEGL